MATILETIDELSRLRDGWDGDNAVAPNTIARALARDYARSIWTAGLTPDRVVAEVSGGIAFWFFVSTPDGDGDLREVSIECLNCGVALMAMKDFSSSVSVRIENIDTNKDLETLVRLRSFLVKG